MKKENLLLTASMFFIIATANAQVQKGDWLPGGSLGFGNGSSSNNNGGSSTGSNSNINPGLGWAVADNSVIGIRGGFNYGISKPGNSSDKTKTAHFSAGAFWKKYFAISQKVGWYTDLSGSYNGGSTKYEYNLGNQKTTSKGWGVSLAPGIYFIPSKKILLNADFGGIKYSHAKNTDQAGNYIKYSNFGVNFLNYFSFGIDFIISK
jgi:hypothetical protein